MIVVEKRSIAPILMLGVLAGCIFSCRPSAPSAPDVSHINLDLQIKRFERDLFNIDTLQTDVEFKKLRQNYPLFFDFYAEQLMRFGKADDGLAQKNLLGFVKQFQGLYDSCMVKYNDIGWLNDELEQAFKYYKHYLPNKHVPKVITHISEFGPAAFTYDTLLIGINLDKYLGKDFSVYSALNIPRYISRRFEPQYITANALKAQLQNLFPKPDGMKKRFIDEAVYEGKLLYALDLMLPHAPDSVKLGFSGKEVAWCKQNEGQMWAFFIEKELLYNSDYRTYGKFLNESPTSSGMPPESPGRTGAWIGKRIVEAYMARYPQTTLGELMKLHDGQRILAQGKYKP